MVAYKVEKQVNQDAYLGGRDEGGVGMSFVNGLLAGDDMTDDRLDTVVGNLRLTETDQQQSNTT